MQRQIILDTETTGLEPAQGHRIIEIGAVELIERRLTGQHFHHYLQPDREIDEEARAVHGISNEFLADKPRFAQIADEFLAFVSGAELIIHNAPFDVGFIDAELARLTPHPGKLGSRCHITDTLVMARRLHPGSRVSLDALCKRYGVDNTNRELHGALLDARILAEVYLAMTGGQVTLLLASAQDSSSAADTAPQQRRLTDPRPSLKIVRASAAEQHAHAQFLQQLRKSSGSPCPWPGADA
ncbi:DNA polymerase III subunit epsilon [Thiorhodospira sibirica]|uniref:DNA polymerase III subunit epsilon n=1 Tax=Thiorhodospira sibirica TaxID=154347 RepID=UPI00022C33F7|nr:DNA polymerase III subunit epsilon [Thiorhodospira sibirica]